MITSFRTRPIRLFFERGETRRLPVQNVDRVRRLLTALNAAVHPNDMDQPGLYFHSLAPGQPGRYAVRVSANYRLTFAFDGRNAVDVDLEDYH